MHKKEFGQTYCNNLLTRILEKFISYFLSFISFSTNLRILSEFLEIQTGKSIKKEKCCTDEADSNPRLQYVAAAAFHARSAEKANGAVLVGPVWC
jgi:hypothetical protein